MAAGTGMGTTRGLRCRVGGGGEEWKEVQGIKSHELCHQRVPRLKGTGHLPSRHRVRDRSRGTRLEISMRLGRASHKDLGKEGVEGNDLMSVSLIQRGFAEHLQWARLGCVCGDVRVSRVCFLTLGNVFSCET